MNLHQQILTNNNCYKDGRKITVKGLMLHSTGANNPKVSRYVGPDDGILGTPSPSHWNQPKPGGRSVCVHGFIGKLKDGSIGTYQTLPWNHRGWHSGSTANDSHIGVEICEDALNDAGYFNAVYQEAVELFAYLCKEFNLTEKNIIDHSEGHKRGIASNHGDVMHWFPKFGKSMDTFRADVAKTLGIEAAAIVLREDRTIDQMAHDVIAGKYGSGDERKRALGGRYDAVQERVNELLGAPKQKTTVVEVLDELARDVIAGKYGSGNARRKALGDRYDAVQKRVNELLTSPGKSISELADEVILGLHGSGRERMLSLGKNYAAVQQEVNRRLRNR